MYHPNNSRKRSFLRASRPISAPVGASADTLLVEAFSVAALALDCYFIALSDVFDAFRDDLVGVRAVRLAMLPRKEERPPHHFYILRHLISGFVELNVGENHSYNCFRRLPVAALALDCIFIALSDDVTYPTRG